MEIKLQDITRHARLEKCTHKMLRRVYPPTYIYIYIRPPPTYIYIYIYIYAPRQINCVLLMKSTFKRCSFNEIYI